MCEETHPSHATECLLPAHFFRPHRFYAKVTLDPNRPTQQVSNTAQSILSELDRVRETKMNLTLDIDAETTEGFPEDVESVVRDNAASLRINGRLEHIVGDTMRRQQTVQPEPITSCL